MKITIVILLAIFPRIIAAKQHEVGPSFEHKSRNAFYLAISAQEVEISKGDTINIEQGVYRGNDVLAVWKQDELLIRGIGERPELYADGAYIIGKGIFVPQGNDIRYENFAFFDASVPDQNGAGIRLDGSGLTVRNCLFYNNENGILANTSENGEVLIEYSEFAVGGFGDGLSHNIYINHCALLTVQFCYFHSAFVGHQIKSRAHKNLIQYNRIADLDGNSSRLVDLPNGGQSLIMGNEIIQGVNAENNNLIGYGLEGLANPAPHNLKVISNTILNYRNSSCVFLHVENSTDTFLVANNILGGSCLLFNSKQATMLENLISGEISEIMFTDEDVMDYSLEMNSPATEAGSTSGISDSPAYEYMHPVGRLDRMASERIDLGAHEEFALTAV